RLQLPPARRAVRPGPVAAGAAGRLRRPATGAGGALPRGAGAAGAGGAPGRPAPRRRGPGVAPAAGPDRLRGRRPHPPPGHGGPARPRHRQPGPLHPRQSPALLARPQRRAAPAGGRGLLRRHAQPAALSGHDRRRSAPRRRRLGRRPGAGGMKVETLRLRPAALEDAKRLFDWRNDPLTRAMSLTRDEVVWEDHLVWLERSLARTGRLLLIGEATRTDEAIGVVRFDAAADGFQEVGVTVAPAFRGR